MVPDKTLLRSRQVARLNPLHFPFPIALFKYPGGGETSYDGDI